MINAFLQLTPAAQGFAALLIAAFLMAVFLIMSLVHEARREPQTLRRVTSWKEDLRAMSEDEITICEFLDRRWAFKRMK